MERGGAKQRRPRGRGPRRRAGSGGREQRVRGKSKGEKARGRGQPLKGPSYSCRVTGGKIGPSPQKKKEKGGKATPPFVSNEKKKKVDAESFALSKGGGEKEKEGVVAILRTALTNGERKEQRSLVLKKEPELQAVGEEGRGKKRDACPPFFVTSGKKKEKREDEHPVLLWSTAGKKKKKIHSL